MELILITNGEEGAPFELEDENITLSEDGTQLNIKAGPLTVTFSVADGKASSVTVKKGNNSYVCDRTADAAPDHTVPVCPTCGKEMSLTAIAEDSCTWECDSLDCGVVSAMNHLVGGICICDTVCLHEYGTEGKAYYTCIKCGHVNEKREAEQKAGCTYTETVSVQNGTFDLTLNGKAAGSYTFASVRGGWSISDEDGYLTIVDGKLTHTSTPTAWQYTNGGFAMTVKTTRRFLWFFMPTRSTTYYLASANSVSTYAVKATLSRTVTADHHEFTTTDNKNGTHTAKCNHCGESEVVNCVYDSETNQCVCGAYNPAAATVEISAKVTASTHRVMLFWRRTTYTATISTKAKGTTVKSVQYSLDNGRTWKNGSSFTSSTPIQQFQVRVTDANGNVYQYTYPERS